MRRGIPCATGTAWPPRRRCTNRGRRRRAYCTRWSAITSRPSARRPPVCATEKGCPGSSSRNSVTFCAAGAWPAAFARFRCDDCGVDRLVPFSYKARACCPSCGPSTMLRAVPSKVEGRRTANGGTRLASGGSRVPAGAGTAVGLDAAASAALPAGVGPRPVLRGGPSTMLRTIPSHVEGWRSLVVRFGNPADPGEARTIDAPTAEESAAPRATEPEPGPPHVHDGQRLRPDARLSVDLMRRSFSVDVLACPRCGGRLRLIALIEEASVIERILRHLRVPTDVPTPRPGRAPPLDVARGALSRVEGRRFSRPASLTKTFTSRPSPLTSDRRAELGSPEVCPPSSGAPRSATSSLTRRRQRRQ